MKYFIIFICLIAGLSGYFAFKNKSELELAPEEMAFNNGTEFIDSKKINLAAEKNKKIEPANQHGHKPINSELPPTTYLQHEQNSEDTYNYIDNNYTSYDGDYYPRAEEETTDEDFENARQRYNRAPAGIIQDPYSPPAIIENEPQVENDIENNNN